MNVGILLNNKIQIAKMVIYVYFATEKIVQAERGDKAESRQAG